jgi:hypothetical protein
MWLADEQGLGNNGASPTRSGPIGLLDTAVAQVKRARGCSCSSGFQNTIDAPLVVENVKDKWPGKEWCMLCIMLRVL